MKLTNESIDNLVEVINLAKIANINKLIIEPDVIRGIDEAQSVALITSNKVPDFGGKSVGINRVDRLAVRLALIKSQGDLEIKVTTSPATPDFIAQLDFSAGKSKAQFRCASIEAVKNVPKNMSDTLVWDLVVCPKIIPTLGKGIAAMRSDSILLVSKDGKTVSFECSDEGRDVFTIELESEAGWIGEGDQDSSFSFKYSKNLINMLQEASVGVDTISLKIGEGGIIAMNISGFDIFMVPEN